VGAMLIRAGRRHGLPAIRIPAEPALGQPEPFGARALRHWSRLLRAQARRAGLATNDHCFGLAGSGHMTPERVRALIPTLPPGFSEIYFHPAAGRDALLDRLMPGYEHEAELAALCDPSLPSLLHDTGAEPAVWSDAPRPAKLDVPSGHRVTPAT